MAVTIFGIVALTVYGTFARTLRSKGLAEDQAELTQQGRSAVARMADELASAFNPGPPLASFLSLRGGTETMPLHGIIFTALSARPTGLSGHDSDQRVINYFFPTRRDRRHAGGDGDREDARRPGGNLLDDDAEDFFAAFGPRRPRIDGVTPERLLRREALMSTRDALDTATPTAFLDDVASLQFRFHNGTEWLDEWDSEDAANYRPLPRAVSIDLGIYDARGEIHHFVTAVDVALAVAVPGPPTTRGGTGGATPRTSRTPSPAAGGTS